MQTTGGVPDFELRYETTSFGNGSNSSLYVELKATRALTHLNTITTSKGDRLLSWHQDHGYANGQNITALGRNETLALDLYYNTTFSSATSVPDESDGGQGVDFDGTNLLSFYQAYAPSPDYTLVNSTMYAVIDQGEGSKGQRVLDNLVYPGDDLGIHLSPYYTTRQNGSSFYLWNNTYYENAGPIDPAKGTVGATEQSFEYQRYVSSATGRSFANYTRVASADDGYEPRLVLDEVGAGTLNIPLPEIVRGEDINVLPIYSWDDWF